MLKILLKKFGEIILIFIGLLLALLVENIKQDRENYNDYKQSLSRIHEELTYNIVSLESVATFIDQYSSILYGLKNGIMKNSIDYVAYDNVYKIVHITQKLIIKDNVYKTLNEKNFKNRYILSDIHSFYSQLYEARVIIEKYLNDAHKLYLNGQEIFFHKLSEEKDLSIIGVETEFLLKNIQNFIDISDSYTKTLITPDTFYLILDNVANELKINNVNLQQSVDLNSDIASLYLRGGDYQTAIKFAKRGIELSQNDKNKNAKLLGQLEAILGIAIGSNNIKNKSVNTEEIHSAISHLENSIKLGYSISKCYSFIGLLYDRIGEQELAILNLNNSIKINPIFVKNLSMMLSSDTLERISSFNNGNTSSSNTESTTTTRKKNHYEK